jgi:hypothetical protein
MAPLLWPQHPYVPGRMIMAKIDLDAELAKAEAAMARNKRLIEAGVTFRGTKPQWKLSGRGRRGSGSGASGPGTVAGKGRTSAAPWPE